MGWHIGGESHVDKPMLDVLGFILGSGRSSRLTAELRERLGIAHRVRFVGWVSGAEKAALLSGSRLVVVPSRAETFGIPAKELKEIAERLMAGEKAEP